MKTDFRFELRGVESLEGIFRFDLSNSVFQLLLLLLDLFGRQRRFDIAQLSGNGRPCAVIDGPAHLRCVVRDALY